ncbi:hypothetical protein E4U42_002775 [Claviceps africana]|uniref:Uncharacterized protein n=1 Tax=Claviceps africana TaxID=83212 RepID=A0A8K0J7S7_9HYPO|nr:hypothetical protein E4U42_002775 [Claviceps africana]
MGTFEIMLAAAKNAASYLLVFIHRVTFHPLRRYPGPPLAKVSDLYGGFHAVLKQLHLTTFLDHQRYGPVMRHGPNKLVFNSIEALHVAKSHVYLLTISGGNPSILNIIDKQQHRSRRRLIGQAINDKAMRDFEPTLMEQINVFLKQLSRSAETSEPLEMTDLAKRLGLDVAGHLAFGFALNTQIDASYRFLSDGIAISAYRSNCYMQFPFLKRLGIHYLMLVASLGQRIRYTRTLRHMIRTRLSEDKHARHDLYSVVAEHLDRPSGGITPDQLWSEALFLIPAGGETTSTSIVATFFYLSRYPDAYQRLAEEVRGVFSDGTEIRNGPKLAACRYLRASLDEALRMSPPVPGTPWREQFPDEQKCGPLVIDGHVIPPGTQVGVSIYSLHHNEKYFEESFVFRPERWLIQDKDKLALMRSAFCPFSLGTRGCAGKAVAYLEMSLVVAKTLWYFDFHRAPGKIGEVGAGAPQKGEARRRPGEFQLYDSLAATHRGPNLVFRPRGSLYKEIQV